LVTICSAARLLDGVGFPGYKSRDGALDEARVRSC
jgi:hypothetical protein